MTRRRGTSAHYNAVWLLLAALFLVFLLLASLRVFSDLWLGQLGAALTTVAVGFYFASVDSPDRSLQDLADAVLRRESKQRATLLGNSAACIDLTLTAAAGPGTLTQTRWSELLPCFVASGSRRLIVTGSAGAGKTTLASDLVLRWLEDGSSACPVLPPDLAHKVPVRLSLTAWPPQRRPEGVGLFEGWVIQEIASGYGFSIRAVTELVSRGDIVPVLDGLDEIDGAGGPAVRAGEVLDLLNRFTVGTRAAEVVVFCRAGPYESLCREGHPFRKAEHLQLDDATSDQVLHYLEHEREVDTDLWSPVLKSLREHPDGQMAKALASPWCLTLIASTYESEHTDLADFGNLDVDQIRERALTVFVRAATRHRNRATDDGFRPPAGRVEVWLANLAAYLAASDGVTFLGRQLSGEDLVLHELWPIGGRRAPRWVQAAMCALVSGLVVWSAGGFRFQGGEVVVAALVGLPGLLWLWPSPWRVAEGLAPARPGIRWTVAGWLIASVGVVAYSLEVVTLAALSYGLYGAAIVTAASLTLAAPFLIIGTVIELADPSLANSSSWWNFVWAIGSLAAGVAWTSWVTSRIGTTRWLDRLIATILDLGKAPWRRLKALWSGQPGLLRSGFAGEQRRTTSPGSVITNDLIASTAAGAAGIAILVTGGEVGALGSHAPAFAALLTGGTSVLLLGLGLLRFGNSCRRYFAMLLCTRGRLPWRLNRFLGWACDAGLMRTAGIAYQFRHPDLRDYLATQVRSAPASSTKSVGVPDPLRQD